MNQTLNIWVVYENPKDFPLKFVARRWELDKPTNEIIVTDTLGELRDELPEGLTRLDRHFDDDPCIVETWV